jgi:hypothetical protein
MLPHSDLRKKSISVSPSKLFAKNTWKHGFRLIMDISKNHLNQCMDPQIEIRRSSAIPVCLETQVVPHKQSHVWKHLQ